MDGQLVANVLNIDFFVYSFGSVVYNNRQANIESKSNGAAINMGERVNTHEQGTGRDDRAMTVSKL